MIVLAEVVHDDDVTATSEDLPELAEAGWIEHQHYALRFYMRTIG